ncbi:MAG: diacylglycerol kinase [Pseudomonadota bacterium]
MSSKKKEQEMVEKISARGFRRLVNAMNSTSLGLKAAFKHEEAFRQEVFLCIILLPLGLFLGQTGVERALLVGSLLLVLIVELLNSAVEAVVDRIGMEYHVLSGRAKDLGSAAVFVVLLLAVVVWLLVLVPY